MSNNHFVIFSAGRDCAPLVRHNTASVIDQTYDDYTHIVVVDESPCDGGGTMREAMRVSERRRAVYGSVERKHWLGLARDSNISVVSDKDIMVVLDLDDSFADQHVLAHLNEVYEDPSIWVTYGQYVDQSGQLGHCRKWKGVGEPRKMPWIFSHLMTFRGFLWNKIKDEDLKWPTGEYFTASRDLATMWPMLEMAGRARTKFLPWPLVNYTARYDKGFNEEQRRVEAHVRSMPPYKELI